MTGVVLTAGFDSSPMARHLQVLAIMDAKGFDGARRDIGEWMVGDIQDCLDGQKLFDGTAMPQSKAAIKRKGKTLIARGHHLYDSYVYQLPAGGVEWGSALVYAAIHHFGGETGGKKHRFKLPARPVMGMGPRQERAIGDILIAEIVRLQ